MFSLNCKGKLLSLREPVVMGIINVTPDSFYKGYLNHSASEIVEVAAAMVTAGAAILDVGGQSTRPGSTFLSATEEADRVIPVIEKLSANFPEAIISIDSFHASVAIAAVQAGASIINDVSGGNLDADMIPAAGKLNVPYICMHMKGTPADMKQHNEYEDLIGDLLKYFGQKIKACTEAGIKDIIIDPGFGFAKNIQQNFHLLKELSVFTQLGYPLLAGLSRKSTVYKTLGTTADEALNGTTVLQTIALQNGANILRVHDVKEAVETIRLLKAYNES